MKYIIPILMLILIPLVYAAEDECKGTIDSDESPCLILLPNMTTTCANINTSLYFNASTFLWKRAMDNYSPFTCNVTFNQSALGTYTIMYSTGDTGSIILEDGNMNFFNLTVYLVFMALAISFIIFMHIFRETSTSSSVVYGWIATALLVIMGAVVASPNFEVIRGVVLFFNVDYYIALLTFATAFYVGFASVNIKKSNRKNDPDFVVHD